MTALVVFAHGSPVEKANEGVRSVTAEAAARTAFDLTETAFLECARPDLEEAVSSLAARGATDITVVPFFLTVGIHLRRDLPAIVERLRESHPGIKIRVTPPLEGHPVLADIVVERAAEGRI